MFGDVKDFENFVNEKKVFVVVCYNNLISCLIYDLSIKVRDVDFFSVTLTGII